MKKKNHRKVVVGQNLQWLLEKITAMQPKVEAVVSETPVEEAKAEKSVEFVKDKTGLPCGPYHVNRKQKRTFISQNAARHRKPKAATYGFRGNAPQGFADGIGVN